MSCRLYQRGPYALDSFMRPAKTIFAVPTYRLRDVAETVETYDEHFWSNGHSVKMMVFDDSSLANHQKVLFAARANENGQRPLLRGPTRKGAIHRLPQSQTARQEVRIPRAQFVSSELRREPQFHADVYAGCVSHKRRRRHAPVQPDREQPRIPRRGGNQPRQASQGGCGRILREVLRSAYRI